jgi:hypothetical protein
MGIVSPESHKAIFQARCIPPECRGIGNRLSVMLKLWGTNSYLPMGPPVIYPWPKRLNLLPPAQPSATLSSGFRALYSESNPIFILIIVPAIIWASTRFNRFSRRQKRSDGRTSRIKMSPECPALAIDKHPAESYARFNRCSAGRGQQSREGQRHEVHY